MYFPESYRRRGVLRLCVPRCFKEDGRRIRHLETTVDREKCEYDMAAVRRQVEHGLPCCVAKTVTDNLGGGRVK